MMSLKREKESKRAQRMMGTAVWDRLLKVGFEHVEGAASVQILG